MKFLIYIGASVGGFIGTYIPVLLWNAGLLSGWSILGSFVGTIAGLFAGYKISKIIEE